jgi:hypothetical protein
MSTIFRRKISGFLFICAAAALLVGSPRAWANPSGEMKFAFVDVQRALNDCRNGKNGGASSIYSSGSRASSPRSSA